MEFYWLCYGHFLDTVAKFSKIKLGFYRSCISKRTTECESPDCNQLVKQL